MLLYVDDAKLFSADHIDLQQSITNINLLKESYQLPLAPDKCQHLPYKSRVLKLLQPLTYWLPLSASRAQFFFKHQI